MSAVRLSSIVVFGLLLTSSALAAGGKRVCEVKKNGKTEVLSKEEAPNRKACKAKGGKWVKEHEGGAGHDHDHDHEEE